MIEIIPAIDIIDGKCVRLTQGDYSQKKIYNENPLEVAKSFEDSGIKRLHLVDLDGAKAKKIINHKVLESIASNTDLIIDFGGGLQSSEDLGIAFSSGASMITGGSIAVKNKEMFESWLNTYGPEKIILGADAKDKMIAVSGWQESSELEIISFIAYFASKDVKYVISTDIAKDGLLQGPSFELYSEISIAFPKLSLIASGGISTMDDVIKLNAMGVFGVIVGKAIYENHISLSQIKDFYA